MTTIDTQVPAWLNLDALGIPEAAVHDIQDATAGLLGLLPKLKEYVELAECSERAVASSLAGVNADGVDDLVRDVTGLATLWKLLGAVEHLGGRLTQSLGDSSDVDEMLELVGSVPFVADEIRARVFSERETEAGRRLAVKDITPERIKKFTVEEVVAAIEAINRDLADATIVIDAEVAK